MKPNTREGGTEEEIKTDFKEGRRRGEPPVLNFFWRSRPHSREHDNQEYQSVIETEARRRGIKELASNHRGGRNGWDKVNPESGGGKWV